MTNEFEIRFTDVDYPEQEGIRAALKELAPPPSCLETFAFDIRRHGDGLAVGCRQVNGPIRCFPQPTADTHPEHIAQVCKQLICDCWQ